MTPCPLFARAPARASLVIALALGLSASSASAQSAKAAPVASSTFDVCADEASGKWRYSGVVTVTGVQGSGVALDSRVQNQTSREGYRDALRSEHGPALAGASETVVLPYAFEAAPLTLGVLRHEAQVQLTGESGLPNAPLLLSHSGMVTADMVCGCPPKGCVRTQGYWGNKPGVAWRSPYARSAPFFSSGRSWQQILDTPPRGSAYLILAHQYIAAVLNRAAGASAPSGVQSTIDAASTWLRSGTTAATCGPGQCPLQKTWAGTLDVYNNGQYPGAPKHCD